MIGALRETALCGWYWGNYRGGFLPWKPGAHIPLLLGVEFYSVAGRNEELGLSWERFHPLHCKRELRERQNAVWMSVKLDMRMTV